MELADKLDEFFQSYGKEINISDIIKKFKLSFSEVDLVVDILYQMELDGKIIGDNDGNYQHKPSDYYLYQGVVRISNKNKYYIVSDKGIVNLPDKKMNGAEVGDSVYVEVKKGTRHIKELTGEVKRVIKKMDTIHYNTFYKAVLKQEVRKKYYYVEIDGKKVYIDNNELKDAYVGDTVSVLVTDNKYAKVVEILERSRHQGVLKYRKLNDKLCFTLLNEPNKEVDVLIDNDETFAEGDCILVKYQDGYFKYISRVHEKDDLKSKIDIIMYGTDIPIEFSLEAMKEADEAEKNINMDYELSRRVDLRNLETFTIDGITAKDLDDSISMEIVEDGYILYVNIADVPVVVRPGTKLYEEAYLRTTSVYPAEYVYPMLPPVLSNGLFSLNSGKDKLTKTYKIKFDYAGNIVDFQIFNSVINSNYRMNYNAVNDILVDHKIDPDYVPFVTTLLKMNELSSKIEKRKIERGAVCFDIFELCLNLGIDNAVASIESRDSGPAEKLIENFMLSAGQVASAFAYYLSIDFQYRNHDVPNIDQLMRLRRGLDKYKKYFKSFRDFTNPMVLQKILYSINRDTNNVESMFYSGKILSCMNRAYYADKSNGHYALALPQYGTVTSPIRRFPDLFNSYSIGEVLDGNIEGVSDKFDVAKMSERTTLLQMQAEEVERQTNNMLLNDYVMQYRDTELIGEIIFINRDIICIKTKELLYGNIPIGKNEARFIDEAELEPGDMITVKVNEVSEHNNEIKFIIVNKNVKRLKKERRKKK